MIDDVYQDAKERMGKTLDSLDAEMKKVRTGRASLTLMDGVRVNYYGTPTPLNQMASLAIPESRLITIQPWDATVIKDIEKAILAANIGLTPSNDGKIIRVSVPPLTEERRKEIVRQVGKTCEEYRVGVRNIRRDANELLKSLKKDGDIAEDAMFKGQEQIQKLTDDHVKSIDTMYQKKEKEILEV